LFFFFILNIFIRESISSSESDETSFTQDYEKYKEKRRREERKEHEQERTFFKEIIEKKDERMHTIVFCLVMILILTILKDYENSYMMYIVVITLILGFFKESISNFLTKYAF
jgi:hypothetical protein